MTLERYVRFLKALDLNAIRLPATVTIWKPWDSGPTPSLTLWKPAGRCMSADTSSTSSPMRSPPCSESVWKTAPSHRSFPVHSSPRKPAPPNPAGPTLTMSDLSCPASHRKTPWSSETLLPPTCGAPTMQAFPAAGSIPAGLPRPTDLRLDYEIQDLRGLASHRMKFSNMGKTLHNLLYNIK